MKLNPVLIYYMVIFVSYFDLSFHQFSICAFIKPTYVLLHFGCPWFAFKRTNHSSGKKNQFQTSRSILFIRPHLIVSQDGRLSGLSHESLEQNGGCSCLGRRAAAGNFGPRLTI